MGETSPDDTQPDDGSSSSERAAKTECSTDKTALGECSPQPPDHSKGKVARTDSDSSDPSSCSKRTFSRQTSPVLDLPDLRSQLLKAGIYEEYLKYRDKYRQWRKGGSQGAKGEVSDVAKQAGKKGVDDFEMLLPTPQKFQFFFTVSYWGAVLSLEGSLFFTFSSALLYVESNPDVMLLMGWCNFIGASIFTASVYCFYLELINLQDTERVYTFPSWNHWAVVLKQSRRDSFMGTMSLVAGSILANVMTTISVLPGVAHGMGDAVPVMACVVGFLFFAGGVCEVSQTSWGGDHGHVSVLSSAIAWLNCTGGLCFFLGGAMELFWHHHVAFIRLAYLVGSLEYTVASALLLVMWQGNDFGGTLLNQLNHAICAGSTVNITPSPPVSGGEGKDGLLVRVGGSARKTVRKMSNVGMEHLSNAFGIVQSAQTKVSLRDVVSLCICCWLFVCTTANLVLGLILLQSGHRDIADVAMTLIWALVVKVVLVVHSAITTVPNEQPYRFAMQSMRFLLLFAAAVQTTSLFSSIPLGVGHHNGFAAGAPGGHDGAPASLTQAIAHGGEL